MEIRKLGILYFSLFTWYQSQERKPNFFFFGVIVFSFRSLLRRRISFSPPQPLQPPPTAAVSAAGDFSGGSSPAETHIFRGASRRSTGQWKPRRKPAADAPSRAAFLKQPAVHAPARVGACGRVWARVFFSGDGTPHAGSSGAVFTFYPSGDPTRALLIHLLAFSASADAFSPSPTPSVHLRCLQFILSHLQFLFSRILYGLDLLFLHLQAPQP